MTGRRVTIGWEDLNPLGAYRIVEDMWADPPKNHYPDEKSWKGWTFLELKDGESGQSSNLGGGSADSKSQETPPRQSGYPKKEEEKQDPHEKNKDPGEKKGTRKMGDFTPIHRDGHLRTKEEGNLPEVTVVTKIKFPGSKEYVKQEEIDPMQRGAQGGSRSSDQQPHGDCDGDSEWEEVSEPAEGSGF